MTGRSVFRVSKKLQPVAGSSIICRVDVSPEVILLLIKGKKGRIFYYPGMKDRPVSKPMIQTGNFLDYEITSSYETVEKMICVLVGAGLFFS